MLCQKCQTNEVTIQIKKLINHHMSELFLCEECARETGQISIFENPFSFQNLVAGFLNGNLSLNTVSQQPPQISIVTCPICGMSMQTFSKTGKFGCPSCYTTFRTQLPTILKNFQGGYFRHQGKSPKKLQTKEMNVSRKTEQNTDDRVAKIAELKKSLQEYVAHENFEKAAETRDVIRDLELSLEKEGNCNE